MSERSPGGPILRKRGTKKRTEEQPAKAAPSEAAPSAATAAPAPKAKPKPAPRVSVPRGIGRKVYDPRAGSGDADAPVARPSGSAPPKRTPAGDAAAGPPKRAKPKSARAKLQEKEALKGEAQVLAKEKGIPLVHAYRILKGQTTLNEVLKGMMRRERFDKLVGREGIDRELAGQVAAGHLPKERAVVLTRMRNLRKQKLHLDAIKTAEIDKRKVAIHVFERDWALGTIKAARPYDFDFLVDGAEAVETLFKHDVKALIAPEDVPAAKSAASVDDEVRAQGLKGTENRSERVRPSDAWMLELAMDERMVRFTARDGELYVGRLRSFGRWDAELVLADGEIMTIFFHALHPKSGNLGLAK